MDDLLADGDFDDFAAAVGEGADGSDDDARVRWTALMQHRNIVVLFGTLHCRIYCCMYVHTLTSRYSRPGDLQDTAVYTTDSIRELEQLYYFV